MRASLTIGRIDDGEGKMIMRIVSGVVAIVTFTIVVLGALEVIDISTKLLVFYGVCAILNAFFVWSK